MSNRFLLKVNAHENYEGYLPFIFVTFQFIYMRIILLNFLLNNQLNAFYSFLF